MGFDALFAEMLAELRALRCDVRELKQANAQITAQLPAKLVDVATAATALNICTATAQRWARSGKLPATKRGRLWFIDLARVKPIDADTVTAAAADARSSCRQ